MRADFHDGREQTFPSKGRIQMRKTNHLQIIKSSLQRTAGPYKWVTNVIFGGHVRGRLIPQSVKAGDPSQWSDPKNRENCAFSHIPLGPAIVIGECPGWRVP